MNAVLLALFHARVVFKRADLHDGTVESVSWMRPTISS